MQKCKSCLVFTTDCTKCNKQESGYEPKFPECTSCLREDKNDVMSNFMCAQCRYPGSNKETPSLVPEDSSAKLAPASLPDVQNTRGDFKHYVVAGVSNVMIPIKVKARDGALQTTTATVDMYVGLQRELKGINMSRLPIILNEQHMDGWVLDSLDGLLTTMLQVMDSDYAQVQFDFPYFYTKAAPTTGTPGIAHVDVTFKAHKDRSYGSKFKLTVDVPITTLCPCSKEISDQSAHNQRAHAIIEVQYNDFVWIEELIAYAEAAASSAVYPVLKRPDEKFVTEYAYEHPMFVEDVARTLADKLDADDRITWYQVITRSEESIHQHDAVALATGGDELF